MINNKAYINGVEVSLDFASIYHDVISKINIGEKLNQKERSFYLLFIATSEQIKEFLKNEKEGNKD